jgi:hypothetical protein
MWKQQLELERSNLLQRVIALKKALAWFSGPFRAGGDSEGHRQQWRETQAALVAAEKQYEQFCIKELHRDPWPRPVSLAISPVERAALARRQSRTPGR